MFWVIYFFSIILKYLKVSVYYSLIKLNIFDTNKTSLKGRCHHMKQLLAKKCAIHLHILNSSAIAYMQVHRNGSLVFISIN